MDYGYVGDIDGVDGGFLERLIGIGALPVVSPISADEAGTLLNINADTVASALAVALGAEKLILLGEAPACSPIRRTRRAWSPSSTSRGSK